MRALFYTLGCKLNQVETEALASFFKANGIELSKALQVPDIIIINTCTVTSKAEQKARRVIRQFLKQYPEALLIITGCYAQVEYEYLRLTLFKDQEAAVIPQAEKDILLELSGVLGQYPDIAAWSRNEKYDQLNRFLQAKKNTDHDVFAFHTKDYSFHSRAFLKIQDGCDNFCAYCRVPFARGRSVSLDPEIILRRTRQLVQAGFREIVLTGVHITDYKSASHNLTRLISMLLKCTRHVRFRLSSLEPEDIDEELCRVLDHENICPHFHLPVQSGSARVLAAMKRKATPQSITRSVKLLRDVKPDAFIAADIIVGFPGETQEDFEATRKLVSDLRINKLHVFPFSPRPGTQAFNMRGRVISAEIKRRSRWMLELSESLLAEFLTSWPGKEVCLILEQKLPAADWQGTSAHSIKCVIREAAHARFKSGMLVNACVTDVTSNKQCTARLVAVDKHESLFFDPEAV
ncbi:MAG: tRNA (N(6)-L-threonylcarbamoyladenosine(37)-C(2))-methylthiotransferase MtaB [Spirochaetales bacterium]|nr:tRNA (N(6)-L-threonylcarbamoyladenosine(37)-C(2))-methylthiotransferase MtaB [Spirochaetales bacterium]